MSLKIWDGLKEVCTASEQELLDKYSERGFDIRVVNKNRYYAYKDNGSNILAVAHMDTAMPKWSRKLFKFNRRDGIVLSPALDDRLGVFIITEILPKFGVMPDILLTTDEEIGASTAGYFRADKEYNWIFSFDRNGSDVVLYDYENEEIEGLLEDNGFRVGWGTWSDICFLEHLGVTGFNFGTGYYKEHTKKCNAVLDVAIEMVAKFIEFFSRLKDVRLPYVPQPKKNAWLRMGYGWYEYDDGWDDDWDDDWKDDDWDMDIDSIQDAILFEEEHLSLGHNVIYYPLDDITACLECVTCDESVNFNDW